MASSLSPFFRGINRLRFFLGGAAMGFAIAFPRYFAHWVYFPTFPNILDSIGMAAIGTFLFYEVVLDAKRIEK